MFSRKKIPIFLISLLAFLNLSYNSTFSWVPRKTCHRDCRYIKTNFCESKPATIFIHGSLYPLVNVIVHAFDSPLGLVPAKVQGNKYLHGRVSYLLNASDPHQFPLDSFYLFGWSGRISFEAREKASFDLYQSLKNFKGPITIVTHSHGGNVALNLDKVVQKIGDPNFKIDRLILLACPVQSITEDCVKSPVFKKIYSLYSTGDGSQIKDPQGLYCATRKYRRNTGKKGPLFSGRTFPPAPRLIQKRIIHGRRNMCHMEFIYRSFLSRLPGVINLIDSSTERGFINDCSKEYIINVPRDCGNPELMVKSKY